MVASRRLDCGLWKQRACRQWSVGTLGMGFSLLTGLVVAAVPLASAAPPDPNSGTGYTAPVGPSVPAAVAPAVGSPMDEPLRLIAEARRSYQAVRDYTCLFIKRERIQGQLHPNNLIAMKVRSRPFSIYLRWLGPNDVAGQEVVYVEGRNKNMMRVHPPGLRAIAGFVTVDPRDPRVMQTNRHDITEAGIGNLIEKYCQRWEMERRLNKTIVRIADFDYNKRKCTRVETIHPDNSGRQFYSYRNLMYFDKTTHLPIRVENYDWPRPGYAPALFECYSFAELRVNVHVGDEVFNH